MNKMNKILKLCLMQLIVVGLIASFAKVAPADVYINEIFFNPPSTLDLTSEYIELRGTPSMSLANHYLIFIENADNSFHTGSAGNIEHIFNLSTAPWERTGISPFVKRAIPTRTHPRERRIS